MIQAKKDPAKDNYSEPSIGEFIKEDQSKPQVRWQEIVARYNQPDGLRSTWQIYYIVFPPPTAAKKRSGM